MNSFIASAPLLYVPGDRPMLAHDLEKVHDPRPYSVGICLEDAVRPERRLRALVAVTEALASIGTPTRPVFVRPSSTAALEKLLERLPPGVVDGFILPKAGVGTLEHWLALAADRLVMPIIETSELLDRGRCTEFADLCVRHALRVPCVRIGANDLLAVLGGLRRQRGKTIYETPLGSVIDGLIAIFAPRGVRLCGSVFDRFADTATLAREVRDDASRGLLGKSAIHPMQLSVIWDVLRPSMEDLAEARALAVPDAPAVFSMHGGMLEPSCHRAWAVRVLELEQLSRGTDVSSPVTPSLVPDRPDCL